MYKLGSLFDGSGGFPLAGHLCGIEPAWASEVEPYPIAVTRSRFPEMRHLGDISRINGGTVEPVDVITFGSPCQDLSIAGKRAGLKHEANGDEETTRSGLFMEAVRIIKEMRKATNGEYPKYALWENVPGAFSSNHGEDFRIVLEELIKICEPSAAMPAVPVGGWPYADLYCGDGWSLAYRTFDAQYWGVPQRRRRIHLVLDLRGQRAGEISFEREGLCGYFAQGESPWKETSGDAGDSAAAADQELTPYTFKIRSGCDGGGKGALIQTDKSATPATNNDQYLFQPILDDQGGSQISVRTDEKSSTLRAEMHGNVPCVMEAAGFKAGQSRAGGIGWQEECAATLSAQCSGTEPTVCAGVVPAAVALENHPADSRVKLSEDGKVQTLTSRMGTGGGNVPLVMTTASPVYCLQGNGIDRADTAGCNGKGWREDASYTLNTIDRPAVVFDKEVYNSGENATGGHYISENGPAPALRTEHAPGVCTNNIVRRLTPTECARLQGFPDRWGDIDHKDELTDEEYAFWTDVRATHAVINGKEPKTYRRDQMLTWYNRLHTDSAEYKMWGNGIALPPALYVMQGIADALEEGKP